MRRLTATGWFWLLYLVGLVALLLVLSGCVTQPVVAQHEALCHTDTECDELESPEYLDCMVAAHREVRSLLDRGIFDRSVYERCYELRGE